MRKSFDKIAEQFLLNEPLMKDVSGIDDDKYIINYRFKNYISPNEMKTDARDIYYYKILNIMVICMRLGSEYSRNLLLALYKTYYKREYNRLKWYKEINEYDLLTLFDEAIREEKGKDAILHATNQSSTIEDRLQEELYYKTGNMNCFPRATLENRNQYIKNAMKGGLIDIDGSSVDIYRLFGISLNIEDVLSHRSPHEAEIPKYRFSTQKVLPLLQRLDEPFLFPPISRIAIMCEIMGIKLHETCFPHFLQMNEEREYKEKISFESVDGFEELLNDTLNSAKSKIKSVYPEADTPEKYQKSLKYFALQLAESTLKHVASIYDFQTHIIYETLPFNLIDEINHVHFMLNADYPGYPIDSQYVLFLAMINYLSKFIMTQYKVREEELSALLHIEEEHYLSDKKQKKKSEDILGNRVLNSIKPKEVKKKEKDIINEHQTLNENDEIKQLKEIIANQKEMLKQKDEIIFLKDQDIINQRWLYEEEHVKVAEYESQRNEYEATKKELVALRNHVFHITETDIHVEPENIEKMKEMISGKKIMIIGGHTNWQKKLRVLFPKWRFVSLSDNLNSSVLEGMDYIYFFTDSISHTLYYKFIDILRKKDLNYYYIHETNIDKNIVQIYGNMVN